MKRLILAVLAYSLAGPAMAAAPVTLRAAPVDSDGKITLGDLFDGAGAAAQTPVATRSGGAAVLNAQAVQGAARRAGLDWANAEGLRTIVVRAGPSDRPAAQAGGNVEVLTYARSLSAGEIVQPQDLVWSKAAAAPADAPSDAEGIIGLSARRPLRAGAAVSARDVSAPQVIKAGEIISVVYDYDGVSLTLTAKAMAGAAVGDSLAVQNPTSKKVIQAVVGPAADRLRTLSRPQYALR